MLAAVFAARLSTSVNLTCVNEEDAAFRGAPWAMAKGASLLDNAGADFEDSTVILYAKTD